MQRCLPHLVESTPLLLEDVQADVAVRVHVRVEAGGGELHRGRLVWVPWAGAGAGAGAGAVPAGNSSLSLYLRPS